MRKRRSVFDEEFNYNDGPLTVLRRAIWKFLEPLLRSFFRTAVMLAFAGSFLALAWNADAILNREQHNAARLSRASEMKKIQEVEMEKLRNEGKVPCAYVERVIGTDSGMNVTARSVVKVEECRVVEIRNAELKANLLFEFPNFPDLPEKEVVKILKKRGYIWVVPLEQAISEAEDNRERDRLISIFGSKALKESQKMF